MTKLVHAATYVVPRIVLLKNATRKNRLFVAAQLYKGTPSSVDYQYLLPLVEGREICPTLSEER
jgi:hypothetical protein